MSPYHLQYQLGQDTVLHREKHIHAMNNILVSYYTCTLYMMDSTEKHPPMPEWLTGLDYFGGMA